MYEIFDKNTGEVIERFRSLSEARECLDDLNANHDADAPLYGLRAK